MESPGRALTDHDTRIPNAVQIDSTSNRLNVLGA
jgi:hypothetical protein